METRAPARGPVRGLRARTRSWDADALDTAIWTFAAENGYTVVTKDSDFLQRSLRLGFPPKVVWLRLGNCSVEASVELLREKYIRVRHFHDDPEATVLTLP